MNGRGRGGWGSSPVLYPPSPPLPYPSFVHSNFCHWAPYLLLPFTTYPYSSLLSNLPYSLFPLDLFSSTNNHNTNQCNGRQQYMAVVRVKVRQGLTRGQEVNDQNRRIVVDDIGSRAFPFLLFFLHFFILRSFKRISIVFFSSVEF